VDGQSLRREGIKAPQAVQIEATPMLGEETGQFGVKFPERGQPKVVVMASENGRREVIEALLEKGASIDLQMKDGRTALMWASFQGHRKVVEVLLDRGARIDLQMENGWSALMVASNKGQREMVEVLLETGASIDLQDGRRETALMLASKTKSHRHREVVEVLLAKGARRAGE